MYIHNNKLEILSGIQFTEFKPKVPFSDVVCDFIYELSSELLKCREAKNYPDIISFAYWCRKSILIQ